ncbi:MAG: TonB-dependent receptor [Bacteroidota bacterium]|nr:TonB-dependent receptor [Bacteroidota bacterium]
MEKLLRLFAVLFLVVNSYAAFSQTNQTIKGKVVDDAGAALPKASVILAGTKRGVQTDEEGNFSIQVPNDGKRYQLTISYVSYATKTVAIAGKDLGIIKLARQAGEAEDVVVIGYQTVRRKDVLASVSSVSAKDLKDIPVNSAAEALEGRLAGVQITTAEGSPDANIVIRVRGGGSITQDNSPLYIIDGVQVENGLSTISPQDIQSIDVLKDASATAIYGARGANGVVIITTKGGKFNNKTTVSYNGFYGIKELPKTLDVLNPYEMVEWNYERSRGNATDSANFASMYGTTWDTLSVYKKMPFVDWQKQVLGNTGTTQTHNVSVNGGGKNTSYNVSYTRNDDKAIVQNSSFQRNNLLLRLDHKATNKLKIGVTARITNQNVYGAGTSAPDNGSSYNRLRNAVKYRPFLSDGIAIDQIDPSLVDNAVGNGLALTNPIALTNAEYRKRSTTDYNITAYATYQITPRISFKTTVGIDNNTLVDRQFEDSIVPFVVTNYGSKPIVELDTTTRKILNNSNVFTYSIKGWKGVHDIDVVVGEETYRLQTDFSNNLWRNIPTYTTHDAGFSAPGTLGTYVAGYPKSVITDYTSLSFFGRVSYAYKQKYLFSANFRADASSKFSPENRWGYFPSTSFAWRITKEKFMENVKFINDMKLRVGYGNVGNNRIGDYLYITTFNPNSYYYYLNGQTVYGYTSAGLVNPNLKWETTTSRNIGLDVSFFRNRLNLSVDYYNNSTSDLLLNTPIASSYGYPTQLQNIGATSNKGLEIQLSSTILQNKAFTWNATFNIAFNTNKIERLATGQSSYTVQGWSGVSGQPTDYIVKVGQPVGTMYGWVTDGMYKVSDFNYNPSTQKYTLKQGLVSDSALIGSSFGPGALKLKDLDGNGVVDVNDRQILGNATPKFTGGLNQQFIYKNFDASIFVNFVYGNSIYNANKIEFTNGYTPNSNMLGIMRDRWRTIDQNGQVVTDPTALAAMNANAKIWKPLTGNAGFYLHSWAVEDGSFLRVNNITLGYSITSAYLKSIGLSKLRFYTTVNNLAVITGYSGYDPEVSVKTSNPLTPGLDYSAYPKSRSIIFGVNVSFQ